VLSARELVVRNRDFRRLFLASVVSLAGDWFSFVAVADLVTELTGRPGAAAFIYALTVLPIFIASPFAGAIADRFDRRRILVIADLLRVPIALSLCLAAWWGSVAIAVVAIVLIGVGASFHDPIANAATPNLVDPDELATAQSLMGAVWGSMLLVGAGIGGVVSELLGPQTAFVLDALSFLWSAWLIARIRRPMQQRDTASKAKAPLGEAIRHIRRDPLLARLVLAKGGVSWSNGIVGLLPAFAHGRFAGTTIATGLLFAARGLGALVGPGLARLATGANPTPRATVLVCGIGTLGYGLFYAVFPIVPVFAVAIVLVIAAHLGGGAQWTASTYGIQAITPDHIRGRVLAIDYGLATLGIGMSSILAGVLADALGAERATWWLTGIAAVYGSAWLAWSLRHVVGGSGAGAGAGAGSGAGAGAGAAGAGGA
jgi:MFS family permease